MADCTLTKEQLEALNDGVSIAVDLNLAPGKAEIAPPCEEFSHDWGRYRITNDDGEYAVTRRCGDCGEVEEADIDPDQLFKDN